MENTNELIARLANVSGVRFAHIEYNSDIKTSAKYKDVKITKDVSANIQIFGSILDYTNVYKNAIIRSGKRIEENDISKLESFEVSDNYFYHPNNKAWSLVEHKTSHKQYIYCLFNSVSSTIYYVDGIQTEKENIFQYLTPSEVKKLTEGAETTYNKRNDVYHTLIPRTIKLENIKTLNF